MKNSNKGKEIYDRLKQHVGGGERMTKWMLIKLVNRAVEDAYNEGFKKGSTESKNSKGEKKVA